MKYNFSETGSNWCFWQNVKNMSTKQEIVSDATFKAWPFSSDFNFACQNSQVTAATCKYYCPFVVNLTIAKLQRAPSWMKHSFEICLWKCCHAQKLVRFCVKTGCFSYYFEILPSLSKVIDFFYYFLQYDVF